MRIPSGPVLLGLVALTAPPAFAADGTAAAAVADDNAASRDSLRDIDPPWYDRERDSWHRIGAPPDKKPEKTDLDPDVDLEPVFIVAVIALVAIVLGGLIALLLRKRLPETLPEQEVAHTRPASSNVTVLAFVPAAGAADPEAALKAALAAQDWRAATIWIYALTLLALEHAGMVRLDAGKTDRAYVREAARAFSAREAAREASRAGARAAAPAPGMAAGMAAGKAPAMDGLAAFTATVQAFSAVYFGHQPADAASVARMQQARADLLARVGRK